jgi:hypothetical protein
LIDKWKGNPNKIGKVRLGFVSLGKVRFTVRYGDSKSEKVRLGEARFC